MACPACAVTGAAGGTCTEAALWRARLGLLVDAAVETRTRNHSIFIVNLVRRQVHLRGRSLSHLIALQTALPCSALHWAALHCSSLQYSALLGNILPWLAVPYATLHHLRLP